MRREGVAERIQVHGQHLVHRERIAPSLKPFLLLFFAVVLCFVSRCGFIEHDISVRAPLLVHWSTSAFGPFRRRFLDDTRIVQVSKMHAIYGQRS